MAMLTRLTPGSPKMLQRFQNCIAFMFPSLQIQHKSTDAIDCFTNELVYRKSRKWEELREGISKKKSKSQDVEVTAKTTTTTTTTSKIRQNVGLMTKGVMSDIQELRSPQLGLDIRTLSRPQLDNLLLSTLEIKNKVDFLYLIRQCIQWKRLPSHDVLIPCLKYLSSLCRLQQIESFAEICRDQDHPLSKTHADLAPFRAMALWRSGSADLALQTLQQGYAETTNSEEGRRLIRVAFRTIVEETLTRKSEAILVILMEVARSIYTEYKDIFVLACIWKQCFVSDWFCDQKVATDLFEHYRELQQLVGRRSNAHYICSSFLSRQNVDAVHRLIEVFLHGNQKDACASCLSLLFNYQYFRKDLRACAEIIKSCSELEMPLSELQNEQFLSLFLDQTDFGSNGNSRNSTFTKKPIPKTTPKEYQYKF